MKKEEILKTLCVFAAFFLVFFLVFKKQYFVYLSIIFLLLGIFENPIAPFIHKLWMKFSEIIGRVSSFFLLALIFFLILTPVAIFRRLFNKEIYNYFFSKDKKSFFKDRDIVFSKEYFEKLW